MANSSSRRNFLAMVNASAAPDEIGIPTEASQWEMGWFSTGHPRQTINRQRLPSSHRQDPLPGDRVYIWINQNKGGSGLTAVACAADVLQGADVPSRGTTLRLQVADIPWIRPGIINNRLLDTLKRPGNVFEDIRKSTVKELRYIPDVWVRQIDEVVSHRLARNLLAGQDPASPQALLSPTDQESIASGCQARLRLIEQRANQGPFRDAVMARDGCRCVVTGCRASEVLEAAHLIPYASGHPERARPGNGILLRADIHLLFDRGLMAIDPQTMSVWLSERLHGTAYGRLHRKGVRTAAGPDYLRHQYEATAGTASRS
jgi:HNH endonuclease